MPLDAHACCGSLPDISVRDIVDDEEHGHAAYKQPGQAETEPSFAATPSKGAETMQGSAMRNHAAGAHNLEAPSCSHLSHRLKCGADCVLQTLRSFQNMQQAYQNLALRLLDASEHKPAERK